MAAFSTTHDHVPIGVAVDRADKDGGGDGGEETAMTAAVWAGERYDAAMEERTRQETERREKARLRHKHALGKEMLKQVRDGEWRGKRGRGGGRQGLGGGGWEREGEAWLWHKHTLSKEMLKGDERVVVGV